MMIDKLITATKAKHRDEPIQEELYAAWRANPVTIRLMEELEVQCMELMLTCQELTSDSMEELGMSNLASSAATETSYQIINWKPQELMTDED
jgi:hypothetical protein